MVIRGELEVTFGRNKRCVHDIRYSQVYKKIIDGSPAIKTKIQQQQTLYGGTECHFSAKRFLLGNSLCVEVP